MGEGGEGGGRDVGRGENLSFDKLYISVDMLYV